MKQPHGILLIDKEVGPTSHDIIYQVRKKIGEKRIGHSGTLDPFASGLMVVLVGECTRLQDRFLFQAKSYEAEITFGSATDTEDHTGKIIEEVDLAKIEVPSQEKIEVILNTQFHGEISQRPPIFSAKHIGGERAYDLARQGLEVNLESKRITIYSIKILQLAWPRLTITTEVGSGTYIRSLARDIGTALGVPAHLSQLRRTSSGKLKVHQAKKVMDLKKEDLLEHEGLIRDCYEFKSCLSIKSGDEMERALRKGVVEVLYPHFGENGFHEVSLDGQLAQVYEKTSEGLKLKFNLMKV